MSRVTELHPHLRRQLIALVTQRFSNDVSGHDPEHALRVARTALHIGHLEKCPRLDLIEIAALLHDYSDPKLCDAPEQAKQDLHQQLLSLGVTAQDISCIESIIRQVSFRGAGVNTTPDTLEARIVQDADRLDALGAIGIARCFAYGASRGRPIFRDGETAVWHADELQYRNSASSSLNHFYEKLLLLYDRMQTPSGKRIAYKRHRFLKLFLNQFLSEWNGSDLPR